MSLYIYLSIHVTYTEITAQEKAKLRCSKHHCYDPKGDLICSLPNCHAKSFTKGGLLDHHNKLHKYEKIACKSSGLKFPEEAEKVAHHCKPGKKSKKTLYLLIDYCFVNSGT